MKPPTHIGRPIDLSYLSNRLVVILSVVGAATGFFFAGDRNPLRAAFDTAMTVFLVWALTREIHPENTHAATAAAVVGGGLSVWTGDTSLIALAGLMLSARVLVRTTGLWPRLSDILVIGIAVGVFARTPLAWATGMAVAVAFAFDTFLPQPAPATHLWLAGAVGTAVTLSAVISGALPDDWTAPAWPILAVMAAIGVAAWVAPVLPLTATADLSDHRLDPRRLQTARRIAIISLAVGVVAGGSPAAPLSYPAWASLASVAASRVFMTKTVQK